jgi:nucleotide-binding universal stress UspA family protein
LNSNRFSVRLISASRLFIRSLTLPPWLGGTTARLTVLHVVATFDPVPVRGGLDEPLRVVNPLSREQMLEEMGRSLDLAAVSPHALLVAEAGDPQKTIVDQAISNRADLIVMGTHGRRGFKRLLLGSVAEAVLHEAPCPVLTVPPRVPAAASHAVTFKRILCPVDFSPSALQALGFALDLARQADGLVTLLHVVEWLPEEEPRASAHFNVPEYRRYIAEDAEQRLRLLITEESRTCVAIDNVLVLDARIARSFAPPRTNPLTLLSWVRAGQGWCGPRAIWINHAAGGARRRMSGSDSTRELSLGG